jgi:multiple sugar transport system permease protein
MSFRIWDLYKPQLGTPFIGLGNYVDILTSPAFWNALNVTLLIALSCTCLTLLLGLAEALTVRRFPFGRGLITSVLVIPLVVTPVVVSFAWRFMYRERTGLITAYLLPLVGLNVPTILGSPDLAVVGVIMAEVWNQTPLVFLILFAGLQSLPAEPFEAARVDGASAAESFWYLTLPMLKPVVLIALVLRTIDTLKLFDIVWVLTGGGPGDSTQNLVVLGYYTAFTGYRMGAAAAYAQIILWLVMGISLVYIRLLVGKEQKSQ